MRQVAALGPRAVDVQGVLERLSAHLDRQAAQIFDLEQTVAAHFSEAGEPADDAIVEFQTLDFLRQSLEDVSVLVLLIAQYSQVNMSNPEHLARKLKLDSTRTVLLGSVGVGFEVDDIGSGEVDIF